MRISDWSSDVCSSDLSSPVARKARCERTSILSALMMTRGAEMQRKVAILVYEDAEVLDFSGPFEVFALASALNDDALFDVNIVAQARGSVRAVNGMLVVPNKLYDEVQAPDILVVTGGIGSRQAMRDRSEEHTSELQSLMRISYAVFCL